MGRSYLGIKHKRHRRKLWMRAQRKARREQLIIWMGGKCVDCSTTTNLEFDHIVRYGKWKEIGTILNCSWETILLEATKCQLRCYDCHKHKTREETTVYDDPKDIPF